MRTNNNKKGKNIKYHAMKPPAFFPCIVFQQKKNACTQRSPLLLVQESAISRRIFNLPSFGLGHGGA
jgi:hypothetical protein